MARTARKVRADGTVDIVGTFEAAAILDVERARIGKWEKRGIMPPQATRDRLMATPVWWREDIEKLAKEREPLRREPRRTQEPIAA